MILSFTCIFFVLFQLDKAKVSILQAISTFSEIGLIKHSHADKVEQPLAVNTLYHFHTHDQFKYTISYIWNVKYSIIKFSGNRWIFSNLRHP